MERGDRSIRVALLILLLGCLAVSAQRARTLDLASAGGGGASGDETVDANGVPPPVVQPYCYRSCGGGGPCEYCCGGDYTPTTCWKTQDKCDQECHLLLEDAPAPRK